MRAEPRKDRGRCTGTETTADRGGGGGGSRSSELRRERHGHEKHSSLPYASVSLVLWLRWCFLPSIPLSMNSWPDLHAQRCYDVYDALTSDQPAEERMSPQPLLPTLPDDSREDTVARDDKQTERQHVHEAQPTSLGRHGPRRYGFIAPGNHGHEHILGRDEEGDATS
ncbi:hypothetical protein CNYM01_14144 [Colletotrichum nymphaeae SA-01]|uniref:Uncharacterized protein n=1 Tax=Colletotrichum nymphaeae SA-01 TaxID=1460502 RepID=A0A135UI05_9PEZI|nr:hypothetical protein CNYM01_14144 [Colletotrichum nymphaeae SA-01]